MIPLIIDVDADLEELVPIFLDKCRHALAMMPQALSRGDVESIRRLAHQIRGEGGGFGFEGITEIGKTIELAAKAGEQAPIEAGLRELEHYLSRLEIRYVSEA